MEPPYQKDYKKFYTIGDCEWEVKFVRNFPSRPSDTGQCDPGNYTIRIKAGESREEKFLTFIHEIIHAFEDEYNFELKHEHVYKLERAIADFIVQNF